MWTTAGRLDRRLGVESQRDAAAPVRGYGPEVEVVAHPTSPRSRLSNRAIARLVGAAVVLALFLAFVLQNRRTMPVTFLFWEVSISVAWALVTAGVLGLLVGLVLPRLRRLL